MTGIIVTGGEAPDFLYVKEYFAQGDIVVAADSGLDTLSLYNIEPDLVIGDMDSLKNNRLLDRLAPEKILKYPRDKDFTDTELAIHYLYEHDFDTIWLIGGGGGRLDHIVALYSLFFREITPSLWITAKEKIILVTDKLTLKIKKNSTISLFPVGKKICKMDSNGLKWELNDLTWTAGDSGISNVALKETVVINMICGSLVMIISIKDSVCRYG